MDDVKDAATLLRELRRAQGRSLRRVASDLGVAASYLSRVERGERHPAGEVMQRLANYYEIPAERLELIEGRVPDDVLVILRDHPEEIDRLRDKYGNT